MPVALDPRLTLKDVDDTLQSASFVLWTLERRRSDLLAGSLATVVSRICLDVLFAPGQSVRRSPRTTRVDQRPARRTRRTSTEERAVITDSMGVALLIVLEMPPLTGRADRLRLARHVLRLLRQDLRDPRAGLRRLPSTREPARGPVSRARGWTSDRSASAEWWTPSCALRRRATSRPCSPCSAPTSNFVADPSAANVEPVHLSGPLMWRRGFGGARHTCGAPRRTGRTGVGRAAPGRWLRLHGGRPDHEYRHDRSTRTCWAGVDRVPAHTAERDSPSTKLLIYRPHSVVSDRLQTSHDFATSPRAYLRHDRQHDASLTVAVMTSMFASWPSWPGSTPPFRFPARRCTAARQSPRA